MRCTIPPADPDGTRNYIRTRLRMAGARDLGIFTDAPSRGSPSTRTGIPRVVNTICDHCLLIGYADQTRRIDRDIVDEAIEYLEAGDRPTPPAHRSHRAHGGSRPSSRASPALAAAASSWAALRGGGYTRHACVRDAAQRRSHRRPPTPRSSRGLRTLSRDEQVLRRRSSRRSATAPLAGHGSRAPVSRSAPVPARRSAGPGCPAAAAPGRPPEPGPVQAPCWSARDRRRDDRRRGRRSPGQPGQPRPRFEAEQYRALRHVVEQRHKAEQLSGARRLEPRRRRRQDHDRHQPGGRARPGAGRPRAADRGRSASAVDRRSCSASTSARHRGWSTRILDPSSRWPSVVLTRAAVQSERGAGRRRRSREPLRGAEVAAARRAPRRGARPVRLRRHSTPRRSWRRPGLPRSSPAGWTASCWWWRPTRPRGGCVEDALNVLDPAKVVGHRLQRRRRPWRLARSRRATTRSYYATAGDRIRGHAERAWTLCAGSAGRSAPCAPTRTRRRGRGTADARTSSDPGPHRRRWCSSLAVAGTVLAVGPAPLRGLDRRGPCSVQAAACSSLCCIARLLLQRPLRPPGRPELQPSSPPACCSPSASR